MSPLQATGPADATVTVSAWHNVTPVGFPDDPMHHDRVCGTRRVGAAFSAAAYVARPVGPPRRDDGVSGARHVIARRQIPITQGAEPPGGEPGRHADP